MDKIEIKIYPGNEHKSGKRGIFDPISLMDRGREPLREISGLFGYPRTSANTDCITLWVKPDKLYEHGGKNLRNEVREFIEKLNFDLSIGGELLIHSK